ncbi:MAG TPA: magnesium transporter [Candidatus Saccharimonadales bacterium]|nr:magnesium transporter [Candidatus Saccharimonadales bacterium]
MAETKKHKSKLSGLVSQISFHPDKRIDLFLSLPLEERAVMVLMLTRPIRKDILAHIPSDDLINLLEKVDPDDATDLLQLLPPHKRQKTLERLSFDLKEDVSKLLRFDPDTAAGLMNVDYIQVDIRDSIADVAKKFKLHEKRTGRLPVILATDNERLVGFLPGHELGFVRASEKIGKYVKRLPTVHHSASQKEVMDLFRSHPHNKVAVLDDNDNVIGIIYSDDVLKLMQEQESSSLYDFAGVSAEEGVADTAKRKVKFRYKWLIINLATAFLAAFTVSQFEETISKYVLLAVYMPIVAGMGGNAATQTLAVMVRGIALRQIDDVKTVLKTLKSEAGAGIINGLINGFLVAFIVLIKDNEPAIALILALAMVINLLVAGVFGTMVPLLMSRLHKDPAASATIFITTATDVLGFLAFLGLATLILA